MLHYFRASTSKRFFVRQASTISSIIEKLECSQIYKFIGFKMICDLKNRLRGQIMQGSPGPSMKFLVDHFIQKRLDAVFTRVGVLYKVCDLKIMISNDEFHIIQMNSDPPKNGVLAKISMFLSKVKILIKPWG